jgi:hypothetical protein
MGGEEGSEKLGSRYGLSAPQEFTLDKYLGPGHHSITLLVDNRIKEINVGPDSHSLTDQTQGNWNGVVGKLLLISRAATWLEDVQVFPDMARKMAKVRVIVCSMDSATGSGSLTISAESFNTPDHLRVRPAKAEYVTKNGAASVTIEFPMGEKILSWDEFNPALYRLRVELEEAGKARDARLVEFGMREFRVNGTHFEVNGRLVHLRGDVENCVFPLTGYPPMDEKSWERVFRVARSFGLNHMRFHSFCPPEAAFMAADRVGFYLQPEGPAWANHGSSLGDGKPIDDFIYTETKRMALYYGNYASYCMLAYGNEPRGGHQAEYLTRFIHFWEDRDSRRVYTGADVGMSWPLIPDNQYMVKSGPRGLNWNSLPESMSDYHAAIEKFNVPYVTHEMGQWCAYPDFSEIPKYTGVYKAKNFELFREELESQGMGDEARKFLLASGKLQALCYKMEIEKSLRTPGSPGFQLLCLNDYTGQGTALVGVLNAFWEEKGYMTAADFRRFCNSTVPLARLPKFVYTNNESLVADIEMYHFGKEPLRNVDVDWVLKDDKKMVVDKGSFHLAELPIGNCIPVGKARVGLSSISRATVLNLEVSLRNTPYANDWNCWVYPGEAAGYKLQATSFKLRAASQIYYCTELNDTAREVLNEGGSVFLNAFGKVVKGKEVVMNFTPVFWNTSWFKMRPPHTLGILLDPSHPAFADFPTSYHSDLQWWDILYKAQVMHLEDFPKGFRPIVQPIDTWFLNRRLALIFEARVGKGRLIVSSADLHPGIGAERPAARQLYYSIEKYMLSEKFHPAGAVDPAVVKDLFVSPSKFVFSAYTVGSTDDLRPHPVAPPARPAAGPAVNLKIPATREADEPEPPHADIGDRIDREALVRRHTVVNEKADPLSSLSVGNGRFAFTVDITGLQSFPEQYEKGIPLGTESEWGWHSFRDTSHYRFDEALKNYFIHDREIPYAVQWSSPERNKLAADWFRQNVHRLQLGNIGMELTKKDGGVAQLSDLRDIHQELDMWDGQIKSHFTLEGEPVDVTTLVDPNQDIVAAQIRSPLLGQGRIQVRLRLPYPTGAFADAGDNWGSEQLHQSEEILNYKDGLVLRHVLDTTRYFIRMKWKGNAKVRRPRLHYFLVKPDSAAEFRFSCLFARIQSEGNSRGSFQDEQVATAHAWSSFWQSGGAVDLSGSTDPRAFELERRIVLSQWLTRIQEAGNYPPQETGLTYNSWYGKPHLEMHWWHEAQFALWGRPELLEKSMDWYSKVAGEARKIAKRQGYKGIRWQKMTDPAGRESPSSVGAFLIWQQPHFIYFAELAYRAASCKLQAASGNTASSYEMRAAGKDSLIRKNVAPGNFGGTETPEAVLQKYKDLVFATADFMASYAWYDPATRRYILGKGLIPAQEKFREDSTFNPCFELAYWRWALGIALEWRRRLGLPADTTWQKVENGLAALPKIETDSAGHAESSLYLPAESASDAYTNLRFRSDHPAVLGAFGFLPATKGLDTAVMHHTFEWVRSNWNWPETWGWDFPLMAMTATRLGLPGEAIESLLKPVTKNTYLPDGHNYQDERLRLYLPGNGGLLAAVAIMCAGYDGSTRLNPGIPQDGSWKVRWEGLCPMP